MLGSAASQCGSERYCRSCRGNQDMLENRAAKVGLAQKCRDDDPDQRSLKPQARGDQCDGIASEQHVAAEEQQPGIGS